MVRDRFTIKNPTGLHLRPAGLLCTVALKFQCKITFRAHEDTTYVNAKSVLSVLAACVKCGDEIELICEGSDEEEAFRTLSQLIKDGLGEDIVD